MIPSPTDLTYFLEVASLLNLSRAAETLGISQPSLTLAMQRLEASVGTSILIRQKRGVTLTKAGKQLLAHARSLLEQWDSIKSAALASTYEVQGCFTLGCHPSVALYSLPHFLPGLFKKYPQLEIQLHHDSSRKITEKVINLSIDIGIVINPVKHSDLVIKKIGDDVITFWQSNTNPVNEKVLICDPDLLQTQSLLKKLKKQGLAYDRTIATNNLEVIAELTASGCGIGILPANIAKTKNLARIPRTAYFDDEVCVVYHGENRHVKTIQVITEAIKSALASRCSGS